MLRYRLGLYPLDGTDYTGPRMLNKTKLINKSKQDSTAGLVCLSHFDHNRSSVVL